MSDTPETFRRFIDVIASGMSYDALDLLTAKPVLAKTAATRGALRLDAKRNFFPQIKHYIYEGDTALHIAAAANDTLLVKGLLDRDADVRARNRRGAQPLHYAVDGGPGSPTWNPDAQSKIIALLIEAGADPNATDKSGVGPLHRAIRNRCADAVKALVHSGADLRAPNGSGSTPLLLATLNTGKSGSGSVAAKSQQQEILRFIAENGVA